MCVCVCVCVSDSENRCVCVWRKRRRKRKVKVRLCELQFIKRRRSEDCVNAVAVAVTVTRNGSIMKNEVEGWHKHCCEGEEDSN